MRMNMKATDCAPVPRSPNARMPRAKVSECARAARRCQGNGMRVLRAPMHVLHVMMREMHVMMMREMHVMRCEMHVIRCEMHDLMCEMHVMTN